MWQGTLWPNEPNGQADGVHLLFDTCLVWSESQGRVHAHIAAVTAEQLAAGGYNGADLQQRVSTP
jgi:hypothetical protein